VWKTIRGERISLFVSTSNEGCAWVSRWRECTIQSAHQTVIHSASRGILWFVAGRKGGL
jgi:hypothetical protein